MSAAAFDIADRAAWGRLFPEAHVARYDAGL
jgi:hypothetical protein